MSALITCTWHLVTITVSVSGSDPASTHLHTQSLTYSQIRSIFSRSTPTFLSTRILGGERKFQILLNQKRKSQACHKQAKEGLEGTKVRKANIAR